ncbi:Decaprenyl diphosphate synthase-like protein [Sporodiniella umbellata]|nr:Decaprenyl diphosphate synthase-like protein [Sporodiniella umbellata]
MSFKERYPPPEKKLSSLCLLQAIQLTYILYTLLLSSYEFCLDQMYQWTCSVQQQLLKDQQELTKIPNHLCLHVSNELGHTREEQDWKELINDICSVSCWAYELGIKEISVFDTLGVLKSQSVDVHKRQSQQLNEWIKRHSQREKVTEPYIRFSILSKEDGKPHMASVVRRMTKQGVDSVSKVDMALVNHAMHENTVSDPDLMIVFGGFPHHYVALDGYSPWHLKNTEIINYSRCRQLTYHGLSQCLRRFSKLEQRFGH